VGCSDEKKPKTKGMSEEEVGTDMNRRDEASRKKRQQTKQNQTRREGASQIQEIEFVVRSSVSLGIASNRQQPTVDFVVGQAELLSSPLHRELERRGKNKTNNNTKHMSQKTVRNSSMERSEERRKRKGRGSHIEIGGAVVNGFAGVIRTIHQLRATLLAQRQESHC
jgi:hypothetical protein